MAFERISKGLVPDAMLSVDEDTPSHMPIYMKQCESNELEAGGEALMQLETAQLTLDPKHIKLKMDLHANFLESLPPSITHHTVVSVEGVAMGGYEMAPMVLFDKSGSVCELFDNVLSAPLRKDTWMLPKRSKFLGWTLSHRFPSDCTMLECN